MWMAKIWFEVTQQSMRQVFDGYLIILKGAKFDKFWKPLSLNGWKSPYETGSCTRDCNRERLFFPRAGGICPVRGPRIWLLCPRSRILLATCGHRNQMMGTPKPRDGGFWPSSPIFRRGYVRILLSGSSGPFGQNFVKIWIKKTLEDLRNFSFYKLFFK